MAAGEDDRAKARGSWKMSTRPLRSAAGEDLSTNTTAEERVAMMWPLALASWSLAGELPGYSRAQSPGRLLRGPRR